MRCRSTRVVSRLVDALAAIDRWGAPRAAAGVVRAGEIVATHGVARRALPLGVYHQAPDRRRDPGRGRGGDARPRRARGAAGLDGPPSPGPRLRPAVRGPGADCAPGRAADLLEHGLRAPRRLPRRAVGDAVRPLSRRRRARARRASSRSAWRVRLRPGAVGSLAALLALARELLAPRFVAAETLAEATEVAFPGLVGVLPGFGRQDPCDWGLGFELRDAKPAHWTGTRTSPSTFGHFGGAGTFLWVDPTLGVALGCLTDREFDDWALTAWPALSDAVVDSLA